VSQAEWQNIVSRIATAATAAGLDIVHPFNLAHCRSAWVDELPFEVPRPTALGVLFGNTRRLWPIFRRACRERPQLATAAQPLDSYVTEQLTQIVTEATPRIARLVFAHVTEPRPFPIQRLAEQVGLAALSPCHLAIHPLHGPWLALRAVLVVDVDGPDSEPTELARPCRSCSAPCVPALTRALAASGSPLDSASIAEHASDWIAVRDACPVGTASRYDDAQLSYHYAPSSSKLVQGS
jgi:cyanocobalamin reductase (cyanide-eliminating) / alkylcobalamin dealkylase